MLESQLIQIIKSQAQDPDLIGDDCAVIDIGSEKYLFALDSFVEDVHYSSDYFSVEDIGWKSLAVNISDIAAMAGEPLWVLVGLNLSDSIDDKQAWVEKFYTGLNQCASRFGQPKVIGGDITASRGGTSISIAIIGKASQPLLRSSAQPGYLVGVSGEFGATGKFLEDSKQEPPAKHLRPEPGLEQARQLSPEAALMDASDGLAQALFELAKQSGVSIEVESSSIPLAPGASLEHGLYAGEDYELVVCSQVLPPNFVQIGKVVPGEGSVRLDGQELEPKKIFQHF
ncbi:MAG: thiamine-phosphate kinase [Candidatus Melainabacteria bacterium]|nr:thiamine-phosphate kinase [Candidatus Melainabacteria bacterium]